MKYDNTPRKRRKIYQKSEQNKYDLENLENTEKKLKFSNTVLNVIEVLYDSQTKVTELLEEIEHKNAIGTYETEEAYETALAEARAEIQKEATLISNLWDVYYSVVDSRVSEWTFNFEEVLESIHWGDEYYE